MTVIPHQEAFRRHYIAEGLSARGASSYLTYLRRLDHAIGGLSKFLDVHPPADLLEWCDNRPDASFGSRKDAGNVRSAAARYVRFLSQPREPAVASEVKTSSPMSSASDAAFGDELATLLKEVKLLGARYYCLTGKPLGVTAEVAELEAAAKLGLQLCPPRTAWYDAIEPSSGRRVQIKGKAVLAHDRYRGMCSAIKCGGPLDEVALVLLDRESLEPLEIWLASEQDVANRIAGLEAVRRRQSGTLAVTQFKSIAKLVWASRQ